MNSLIKKKCEVVSCTNYGIRYLAIVQDTDLWLCQQCIKDIEEYQRLCNHHDTDSNN